MSRMTTNRTGHSRDKRLVSVVLCTFEGERYIDEQLRSIINQTVLPDEILILDDGSRDNTINIIQSLQHEFNSLTLIRNTTRLGVAGNFEKGIRLCKHDFVILSDQDDVWKPHRVSTTIDLLSPEAGVGYVFSNAELIDSHSRVIKNEMLWDHVEFDTTRRKVFENVERQAGEIFRRNMVTGATLAFFKPFIRQLNTPPGCGLLHDGWIAFQLSLLGYRGVYSSEPLIYYRIHERQQIGIGAKRAWRPLSTLKKVIKVPSARAFVQRTEEFNILKQASQEMRAISNFANTLAKTDKYIEKRRYIRDKAIWARLPLSIWFLISGGYRSGVKYYFGRNPLYEFIKDVRKK